MSIEIRQNLTRWGIALVVGIAPALVTRAASPEKVDAAIKKGVAALWKMADVKSGIWDTPVRPPSTPPDPTTPVANVMATQWGGTTALCTYALLATGENRDDAKFQKPIGFLKKAKFDGIYAIGVRANVWPFLDTKSNDVRQAVYRDYMLLRQGAHAAGDLPKVPAFYRYRVESKDWDHSCSQYGVLGMWAVAEVGAEIPMSYWQAVDTGWRKHQAADGGWSYSIPIPDRSGSEVNMTAAGVATLFITQQFLHATDGLDCPGNIVDPNIDAGLNFIGQHFDAFTTQSPFTFYYGWYGVERIGVASGRKYFGTTNWYQKGADLLIARQQASGAWGTVGAQAYETALALLFLTRGRAPVAINKLEYFNGVDGDKPKQGNWNQRPRDAANVATWIGKQIEEFLNWQVVDLDAPVGDLHDAPILYMAGNQNVKLREGDYTKLRQYIEQGGLLVGNADCNNADFVDFFQKLGARLFGQYKWQLLPQDSPIFKEQFVSAKWHEKPAVLALSNGARVLMVLLPHNGRGGDYGRHWQQGLYRDYEDSFELMDNLFLYAIDKGQEGGLRNKGQTYVIRPSTQPTVATIKMARLKYPGNWNPEPGGWGRLLAELHNSPHVRLGLKVDAVELGKGKLSKEYAFAHLTGTDKVKLTDAELAELKKYVEEGGTLVVDACGGSEAFGASMHDQLDELIAGQHLEILPLTDQAYTSTFPMASVAYRHFARSRVTDLGKPRLEGIRIKDRTAVYFSGEDLSVGLVGQQIDGIVGYTPVTALNLVVNITVSVGPAQVRETAKHFAVLAAKGPATKPATAPATPPSP